MRKTKLAIEGGPKAVTNKLAGWPQFDEKAIKAVEQVLRSGKVNYWTGPKGMEFEKQFAAWQGSRFAVSTSSGTAALHVALSALGIGPGDEVIVPSYTFIASSFSIVQAGAIPRFADVNLEDHCISVISTEKLVNERTKAIMPVHLFGQTADMNAIMAIARRHRLPVIEDAAQAFGAQYRGQPAGSMGAFGAFSFFPTKNLGAFGDAGLLVTNDAALAERAVRLRNHGAHSRYYHAEVGGNFRLDALQAAILTVKLPHLAEYTAGRQRNACEYRRALTGAGAGGAVEVIPPFQYEDRTHIVNQYTVRVRPGHRWSRPESPRDALRRFLEERGIASAIYYPLPLHRQECFQVFGPHPDLPVAEMLANEVVSLPVFPELTDEERSAVVEAIREFAN